MRPLNILAPPHEDCPSGTERRVLAPRQFTITGLMLLTAAIAVLARVAPLEFWPICWATGAALIFAAWLASLRLTCCGGNGRQQLSYRAPM